MAAFRTPPGTAPRSAGTSPIAPAKGLGARLLRWRSLCGLLLAVGALSVQAGRGTLAYFTSEAASTGNWFMTGKVLLNLADTNEAESSAITASFGAGSFRPGDTAAGYIVVQNSGSTPLSYGARYTATNATGTFWVAGATNPTPRSSRPPRSPTAPWPT